MLGDAVNDVGGCHGDGMIDEGVGSACKMAKVESLHSSPPRRQAVAKNSIKLYYIANE